VSQTDAISPGEGWAFAVEAVILLAGLGLLWRLVLSARGRANSRALLPEWRLPGVDFACYVFFALAGFVVLGATVGLVLRRFPLDPDTALITGGAAQDIGLLLGVAGFHLFYRRAAPAPSAGAPPVSIFRSGLATFLIAMPVVVAATNASEFVIVRLGLPDVKQPVVDILQTTHSVPLKCLLVLVAGLLAPLAEEIVFRGGLFRYFRTRVPRWAAITVTSLLFGALHVSWGDLAGLPAFVPMTLLAAVFCLAYERTGRIGTVIFAHALFNLNMMALALAGLGQ
jgi:membrane protease YdiL (CAAX protease family)